MAIIFFIYLIAYLIERYRTQRAERLVVESKALNVITAPAGHQIHVVSPSGIINLSAGYKEETFIPQEKVLDPILPKLAKDQRVIIAGPSGSGKSTLAKHLIAARSDGQVIIIDPHSPSKILGIDVIGSGRNYKAIEAALESLIQLMNTRYSDLSIRQNRVSVFIDEWTGIRENIPKAGELLKTLLVESRKVNIHLVVLVHSLTVSTLGVDAQIRASATQVQLYGSNSQDRRALILPNTKIDPDGKKTRAKEYQLPGAFEGYPSARIIDQLPSPEALKAQQLFAQGFKVTAIARELYKVEKATGPQIKAVKEMIK